MKTKLILGALLGATICGSAFADSSVDTRRAFCEQADGFVWVEKTKACIPVNPCGNDNAEIVQAYCIEVPFYSTPAVYNAFVEKGLHSEVKKGEFIKLSDDKTAVYTTDGDYRVFKRMPKTDYAGLHQMIAAACFPYGEADFDYSNDTCPLAADDSDDADKLCNEVANLASSIAGEVCRGNVVSATKHKIHNCEVICDGTNHS